MIPLLILAGNLVIRLHLINQSHKSKQKIEELENTVKESKRGITKNYYFNGVIRKTEGPAIISDRNLENIYKEMKSLDQSRNYEKLIELSKEQISKNPEWPTPYLFYGISLGNAGAYKESINQLEYFIKIAPTNQTYGYTTYIEQAKEFIQVIEQKMETLSN